MAMTVSAAVPSKSGAAYLWIPPITTAAIATAPAKVERHHHGQPNQLRRAKHRNPAQHPSFHTPTLGELNRPGIRRGSHLRACELLFAWWRLCGRDELALAAAVGRAEVVTVVSDEVVVVITDAS